MDHVASEAITTMPSTMPVDPLVSPFSAWPSYGSPSYTTAPFMPTGMNGPMPPHPYHLPLSMQWAIPYMNDPELGPQAYWAALHHAYGLATPRAARNSESEKNRNQEKPGSEKV